MQRVQNCAARVVKRKKKYDSISPTLKALHWLPISKRIEFKILLLTYKALHGLAPEYLQELVRIHKPNVSLRSSSKQYLARSKPKLKTYGEKSFSFASHHLWNNMPEPIRKAENVNIFKKALKTHLFKQSY